MLGVRVRATCLSLVHLHCRAAGKYCTVAVFQALQSLLGRVERDDSYVPRHSVAVTAVLAAFNNSGTRGAVLCPKCARAPRLLCRRWARAH